MLVKLCNELTAADQYDFAVKQVAKQIKIKCGVSGVSVDLLFHDVAFEVVVKIIEFGHNICMV
jgi:hypothetical protein